MINKQKLFALLDMKWYDIARIIKERAKNIPSSAGIKIPVVGLIVTVIVAVWMLFLVLRLISLYWGG